MLPELCFVAFSRQPCFERMHRLALNTTKQQATKKSKTRGCMYVWLLIARQLVAVFLTDTIALFCSVVVGWCDRLFLTIAAAAARVGAVVVVVATTACSREKGGFSGDTEFVARCFSRSRCSERFFGGSHQRTMRKIYFLLGLRRGRAAGRVFIIRHLRRRKAIVSCM